MASSPTTTIRPSMGAPSTNGRRALPPPRQRSVPLAVMGVLLCFVGALVFGAVHLRLDQRKVVLAVAHPVAAGQVINSNDLRTVRVSATGVATISETERSSVVGRVAAVPLAPGSLLVRSQLGSAASIPSGQAVVGVALKDGQFPAGLRAGDRVVLVDTGSGRAATGDSPAVRALADQLTGTVVSVADSSDASGVTAISVRVGQADAAALATASANGQLSLVLVAP